MQSNTLSHPAARIEPGELVKIVDTSQEYILKMRMDRDNQGIWKGMEVEFCRGLAAALLGDASKVKFVPLEFRAAFGVEEHLQST